MQACREIAPGLGVDDQLTFGDLFPVIREAGIMQTQWKARFEALDNAKTLSVLPDTGTTTGGEDEMVVDEGSMVSTSRKGARRQTQNTSTMEVTISKAPTPVSGWAFGLD